MRLTARFRPSHRLRKLGDFNRVFLNPRKLSSGPVAVYYLHCGLPHPRLGISVAKKRFKLAVARNRIKRCVRESFRLMQHKLPPNDYVVVVYDEASQISSQDLQQHLNNVWDKCKHD